MKIKLINFNKIKQTLEDYFCKLNINELSVSDIEVFYYMLSCAEIYCDEINNIYEYIISHHNYSFVKGEIGINNFSTAHLIFLYIDLISSLILNYFKIDSKNMFVNVGLIQKRNSNWVLSKDRLDDFKAFKEIRKLIFHPLSYHPNNNAKKIIGFSDLCKKIDLQNMMFNIPMPIWKICQKEYGNHEQIIIIFPVLSEKIKPKIIETIDGVAITDSPSYVLFLDSVDKYISNILEYSIKNYKK